VVTDFLVYLLLGFLMHFFATTVGEYRSQNAWYWELAAVVLWPLAIMAGIWGRS
jgi:hypothetical protein